MNSNREAMIAMMKRCNFEFPLNDRLNAIELYASCLQEAGFHRDEVLRDKDDNCLHLHYDSLACFCHDCHAMKCPEEVLSIEEARRVSV